MIWKFDQKKDPFLHIIVQKQLSVLFINARAAFSHLAKKTEAIVNCWFLAAQLR